MGFKDAGKPHYFGLRERLRRRFCEGGADRPPRLRAARADSVPCRATARHRAMAKALIARFGTFAEAMNAPDERLREVPGIGEAAVGELKLVRAAALRLMRGAVLE